MWTAPPRDWSGCWRPRTARSRARQKPTPGSRKSIDAAAAALPDLIRSLSAPETAALTEGLYALAADLRSAVIGPSTPEILAAAPAGRCRGARRPARRGRQSPRADRPRPRRLEPAGAGAPADRAAPAYRRRAGRRRRLHRARIGAAGRCSGRRGDRRAADRRRPSPARRSTGCAVRPGPRSRC